MIHSFAIFYAIKKFATLRGIKSPVFGFMGIAIYLTIGAFVSEGGGNNLGEYLVYATTASIVAIAIVGIIICLMPKNNLRNGAKPTRFPFFAATFILVGLGVLGFISVAVDKIYNGGGGGYYPAVLMFGTAYASYKYHKRNSFSKLTLDENKPPILWLRSFSNDGKRVPNFMIPTFEEAGTSFEESIGKYFFDIGPFVAFGNPTDYLPTLGAQKIYKYDVDWQEAITELAKKSCAIVIIEGDTAGLKWELDMIRREIDGRKVFILTPTKQYRDNKWGSFKAFLQEAGFKKIPEDPGGGCVFRFNEFFEAIQICKGVLSSQEISSIIKGNIARI